MSRTLRQTALLLAACAATAWAQEELRVQVSWGHATAQQVPFHVRSELSQGFQLRAARPLQVEAGEGLAGNSIRTQAGGGDVDGLELTLAVPRHPDTTRQDLHVIWADLIAAADADSVNRWGRDGSLHPHSPRLTVLLNEEGTRGFSVTLEQLRRERALWLPSLDIYLTTGNPPVPFAQHQRELQRWAGRRVLDRIQREPDATYEQFKALWEDMGHPSYRHPQQRGPGHIVGLTWDSAVPKFGIDRGAGVWNDYGNPDRFQFWFGFGDLEQGAGNHWRGQSLQDGLPIITTVFEREGARYEVEQFAYPLDGPPAQRRGDLSMVLLQRVRVTNLEAQPKELPVTLVHRRLFGGYPHIRFAAERQGGSTLLRESSQGRVLYAVDGAPELAFTGAVTDYQKEHRRLNAMVTLSLPAQGSGEFVVKLPSPMVEGAAAARLAALDYAKAREETVRFWTGYVNRGATFEVPEKAVNDLYRASLWHALRLPRRHGADGPGVTMDLPYSNFAYSQTGTPWPINQAVYVDYALYDLRGYHGIAAEELQQQYRQTQEANGHVSGYANWVSYTPAMMYTAAQNYLLSGDGTALERMLPAVLRAADWTLRQVEASATAPAWAQGLAQGPLNDLTGEGYWAFNQAYAYAGLQHLGTALQRLGHPRADELLQGAARVRAAVLRGFGHASARSPVVQLRDHTWIPYVPSEAATFRRMFDIWYVTDVDTGSVHLIRLGALPATHALADHLLHDHEDNLFYRGLSVANEPVYNQHATAYLLRDDPKAVIRAFYSYMASAFSHTVYEPVEHRFTHGQYFGPPSTDGAWFELYRHMLLRETEDGGLFVGQAVPRPWLEPGRRITVRRAPTRFGPVSLRMEQAANGELQADVELAGQQRPAALTVRFRHPAQKPIKTVTVNGRPWTGFDASKEWVRIPSPTSGTHQIRVSY